MKPSKEEFIKNLLKYSYHRHMLEMEEIDIDEFLYGEITEEKENN